MISSGIRKRNDLRDTVSHETIGLMLRGGAAPGWIKLECVVRHLADIAVRPPDVDMTVGNFHQLWLAAVAPNQAGDMATDADAARPNSPHALTANVLTEPLREDMASTPATNLPPRDPNARRAEGVGRMNATWRTGYLRSMGDAGTHCRDPNGDGMVTAACGQRESDVTPGWRGPVFAVPPLRGDEIARPELMDELIGAVTRPGVSAVGVTTALWGAGGFGKTTMARLLAHCQEIQEQFPDGVVWVTVGEDAAGPELAEKLTNVVGLLSGERPVVTDPVAAGAELGRAIGDRQVLLVVDDVWNTAQVEPFLIGGPETVRLFTSRIRGVLPGSAELVRVDQMDQSEAQQLLTAGVAAASAGVAALLMAVTGRWPVLLALVNGAVRADVDAGRRAEDSMREILHELGATGPTALDVSDAGERHTAVARTIGVSLSRLTAEQRDRYLELAVFGEDVAIPGSVLARYWKTTGGWSAFATRRFCRRLADLALVSEYRQDPDQLMLHDVIRAYLREQTHRRQDQLNRALIDAHRSLVGVEGKTGAWWQLGRSCCDSA